MNPHGHEHAGPEHTGHDHHGEPPDPPATHGMAVVGTDSAYLSHLPMFMDVHDFQVLLEVEFIGPDGSPHTGYVDDRRQHPDALYTLKPRQMVLPELFPEDGQTARSSFQGSVFRHHYERVDPPAPTPVKVADAITVSVRRVVHARQFERTAKRPSQLEYILFGNGAELFFAHLISTPPDFDQLIKVRVNANLSDIDLGAGPRVTVPGRADIAAERIEAGGGTVPAVLHAADRDIEIGIDPGPEFYLEEGELEKDDR